MRTSNLSASGVPAPAGPRGRRTEKAWWCWARTGELTFSYEGLTSAAKTPLLGRALAGGEAVYRLSKRGRLLTPDLGAPSQALSSIGLRLVWREGSVKTRGLHDMFASPEGVVEVQCWPAGQVSVDVALVGEAPVERVFEALADIVSFEQPEAGEIHIVSHDGNSLEVKRVGRAAVAIERENYAPAVASALAHTVGDLQSTSPCGRLILLDGPPGTGKTYLVRGLMHEVPAATFVLLPPQMVREAGRPQLASMLVRFVSEQAEGKPLVLVLEDADECLVPRQSDNMDSIATLLSLSDGIFGSALDIRILATTNARSVDIDPAILRPGRLCTRITVGPLEPHHAAATLHRLTAGAVTHAFEKGATLAEVYRAARLGADAAG